MEDLPDELVLHIFHYLSVEELVSFSLTGKRWLNLSIEPQFWRSFAKEATSGIVEIEDGLVEDWKSFYRTYLHHRAPETIALDLQTLFLMKRLCLPSSSPDFLQLYAYVYYNQPDNDTRQTLCLDIAESQLDRMKLQLTLTFKPKESQCPVFFYGQHGLQSTVEVVAINRRADNPIMVISRNSHFYRAGRGSKYHFVSGEVGIKITLLSNRRLEALAESLGLDKQTFTANTQRMISVDHNTARFESSDTVNWRLRQETGGPSNARIGQVVSVGIDLNLPRLYIRPSPFQCKRTKRMTSCEGTGAPNNERPIRLTTPPISWNNNNNNEEEEEKQKKKGEKKMQAAPLSQEELAHLVEKTKYTAEELKALHQKHNFHEAGGIHRDEFEKVLADMFQVDVNKDAVLISRLFEQFDADHNGIIDFQEFATGLSMIYSEDPKDKLAFVFSIFDLDGDGKITKNEFTAIVQTLWQNDVCQKLFDFAIDDKQITGVRVFVEHFFHEADLNKDGVIDWNEFQQVASKYAHAKPDHKLQVMTHQTGGHVDAFKVLEGGKIRKSVSLKEYSFYAKLHSDYSFMIPYAPTLYQVEEQGDQKYVIMEDLTAPFKKPCVADFKIGITSAGEDASPEKREAMRKKDMESTTVSLGMRITGMKVWDVKKGDYVRYTKTWGRDVTIEKTKEAVSLFFHNGERVRKEIVALALEKATAILEFMKNQRHSRFYSSSLLFLYDGDTSQPPSLTLKMIDFAHVHPIKDGGLDDGYIFGVTNLLHHLEEIEKEASA